MTLGQQRDEGSARCNRNPFSSCPDLLADDYQKCLDSCDLKALIVRNVTRRSSREEAQVCAWRRCWEKFFPGGDGHPDPCDGEP